jgi:tRNA 2-thiouridine synthesizing protein A
MTETHLNLRGLKCPLPALKTRKALRGLAPGDILVVACTDPLAAIDIPNLVRETGDALDGRTEDEGVLTFRIRKAAAR